MLAKIFSADCSHVHQCERLVLAFCIKISVQSLVIFKRLLKEFCIRTFFDFYIFKNSIERRVAAVVRPVSVKNTNFGFCRITVDRFKIFLQKLNIRQVHSKTHFRKIFTKLFFAKLVKAFNNRNIARFSSFNFQSVRNFRISKAAVNRVYEVMLNFSNFVSTNASRQNNHFCATNARRQRSNFCRILHRFTQKRKTLLSRISTLVILSRQIFPDNNRVFFINFNFFISHTVALRLRKNSQCGHLRHFFRSVFNVVAVKVTHSLYRGNAQKSIDFR